MKALVTYDSAYGNTAKVAGAISAALSERAQSTLKLISEVTDTDTKDVDLIVIGSPTQGGRPTEPTTQFIGGLPKELLRQAKIAVFDTRFAVEDQKLGLRLVMNTIGYAAPKMAAKAKQQGGNVVSEPTGFIVNNTEGPLKKGELERAASWASQLISAA